MFLKVGCRGGSWYVDGVGVQFVLFVIVVFWCLVEHPPTLHVVEFRTIARVCSKPFGAVFVVCFLFILYINRAVRFFVCFTLFISGIEDYAV